MQDYTLLSLFLCTVASLILHLLLRLRSRKNLPPGNFGWPLVGETFELLSSIKRGVADSFVFTRMRFYNPIVFKTSFLGRNTAFFCGAESNKFLFSNENKLVSSGSWPAPIRKLLHDAIHTKTGPDFVRLRNRMMLFLRLDRLRNRVGRMDALTRGFLAEEWGDRGEVNALRFAKDYALFIGCAMFTSIEDGARMKSIGERLDAMFEGIFQLPFAVPGMKFWRACRTGDDLRGMVAERRVELREGKCGDEKDLVSHLLEGRGDEMVSDMEIVGNVLSLLLSKGTLASVITFIIKYLGEMPHIYNKVFQGIITHSLDPTQHRK